MRVRWWLLLLFLCSLLSAVVTFVICEGFVSAAFSRLIHGPDALPDDEDDDAIEPAEQRRVAAHEAGHAIAATVLFGPNEVERITVRTRLDGGLYGVLHTDQHNRLETANDILREASVFMGGRAADVIINGAPTNGAGSDLGHVTAIIRTMHLSSGLGGSLLVQSWSEAPSDVRAAIVRDIEASNACAEAIIRDNRALVEALAARVMEQPEEKDARRLSASDFRTFMEGRTLAPLPAACTFPGPTPYP